MTNLTMGYPILDVENETRFCVCNIYKFLINNSQCMSLEYSPYNLSRNFAHKQVFISESEFYFFKLTRFRSTNIFSYEIYTFSDEFLKPLDF